MSGGWSLLSLTYSLLLLVGGGYPSFGASVFLVITLATCLEHPARVLIVKDPEVVTFRLNIRTIASRWGGCPSSGASVSLHFNLATRPGHALILIAQDPDVFRSRLKILNIRTIACRWGGYPSLGASGSLDFTFATCLCLHGASGVSQRTLD
jgi:hypothetical protein